MTTNVRKNGCFHQIQIATVKLNKMLERPVIHNLKSWEFCTGSKAAVLSTKPTHHAYFVHAQYYYHIKLYMDRCNVQAQHNSIYISDLFKLPHMVPNIINLLGERQIKCLAQPNDLARNGTYNIRWQLYIVHGLTKQTTTPSITLIRQTCTSRNIVSLII